MAKIPGFHIKDGKVVKTHKARDASHAIRMKKSKKQKAVRPGAVR